MTTISWIDDGQSVSSAKFWIEPDSFVATDISNSDIYLGYGTVGTKWKAELEVRRWGIDLVPAFDAFLAMLQSYSVWVPDFRMPHPRGSLAGSPVIVSGAAGDGVVLMSGFTPSAVGVLKSGDRIQASAGRMHMVIGDVTAGSDGTASVHIAPPLRTAAVAGAFLTSGCCVEMRCTGGWENPTIAPLVTTYRLSFVEQYRTIVSVAPDGNQGNAYSDVSVSLANEVNRATAAETSIYNQVTALNSQVSGLSSSISDINKAHVMVFSFGDASPRTIVQATSGQIIGEINLTIATPFDGVGAQLSIGNGADNNAYLPSNYCSPNEAATYSVLPNVKAQGSTNINLCIVAGTGASQGSGLVVVTLV